MTAKKPPVVHDRELVAVDSLTAHPDNYRGHPEDQLAHLAHSIREHGFYRNVVVSSDDVILAGHGVVEAARMTGLAEVPVVRLPIKSDSAKARKLVAADNEIGRFAEVDDRALADLLLSIRDDDLDGLLGTGYTDEMLANLLYVTRPASEIVDLQAAMHYVGMPTFGEGGDTDNSIKVVVHFETEDDREKFMDLIEATVTYRRAAGKSNIYSLRWPVREREDLLSIRFVDET